jgi:beta-glucosidase
VSGQPRDKRIEALLRRMTWDEKLALVHGTRDPRELGQAGYWQGLPRLGIPPLRLADGPPGVCVNREATGMPAPVGLSATFSAEAARLYGVVLGGDAKALEQDIVLAPYVNIVRDPLFRRNHTSLSEDPLLNARLGAAEIVGIQSQGIMAMVKHLAGYNGPLNVNIDERALHEIYLPAFEAAVEAGVASVMCAYNRINGPWSCENAELQNGILRGMWGFRGFVTSDWAAVHSPLAITKGVDLEMPGREIVGRDGPYFTDALKAAVESGAVPVQAIDAALARILYQMDRFQLLGRKALVRRGGIDIAADARIVQKIAEQGAVLLQDDGGALPLTADDLQSLALIGPTAGQLASGFMGERAYGFQSRLISPLAALQRSVPEAKVTYSVGVDLTGVPIPTSLLSQDGRPGQAGLGGGSADFSGVSAIAPDSDYAWQGNLTIPEAGDYTFLVQPALDGGSEGDGTIVVDGRTVARTGGPGFGGTGMVRKKWSSVLPTTDGRDNGHGSSWLAAGRHQIEFRANSTGEGPLSIRFAWITPEMRRAGIAAAVAAARSVRTAIVFAWNGIGTTLSLPEDQDRLIASVAAVNPHTIVVLNTGGPVAMPWKDSVRQFCRCGIPARRAAGRRRMSCLGVSTPAASYRSLFPSGWKTLRRMPPVLPNVSHPLSQPPVRVPPR